VTDPTPGGRVRADIGEHEVERLNGLFEVASDALLDALPELRLHALGIEEAGAPRVRHISLEVRADRVVADAIAEASQLIMDGGQDVDRLGRLLQNMRLDHDGLRKARPGNQQNQHRGSERSLHRQNAPAMPSHAPVSVTNADGVIADPFFCGQNQRTPAVTIAAPPAAVRSAPGSVVSR
jgi:hypothetical protein